MLTATYTLVALSVEQTRVRVSLQSFQHYVRSTLMHQHSLTLGQLEYACDSLNRLYQACNWRKTEMYLIPAIRQATERADQLLDELNKLNQSALGVIRAIQQRIGTAADGNDAHVGQLCESMEAFCTTLLQRLEKEEQELFAIARSVIAGDAWFAIANQFLQHDAKQEEVRRVRLPGPGQAVAAAAASTPRAAAKGPVGAAPADRATGPVPLTQSTTSTPADLANPSDPANLTDLTDLTGPADGDTGPRAPERDFAMPALAVLALPAVNAGDVLPAALRQLPDRRAVMRTAGE